MDEFVVVERSGRVFNSLSGAAEALKARGFPAPRITHCGSFQTTDIEQALARNQCEQLCLLVQESSTDDDIPALIRLIRREGVRLGVAANTAAVMIPGLGWTASMASVEIILWLVSGASAVVSQPDLGSPAVIQRLTQRLAELPPPSGLVIGDEAVSALDRLHDDVTDIWPQLDDDRMCWRTAFALAAVAPLPPQLNKWLPIARHLRATVPWFAYNEDGVRRAVSELARAWRYTDPRIADGLALEALHRGFPRRISSAPITVDGLYEPVMNLDVSGRTKVSAFGFEYDELPLSLD